VVNLLWHDLGGDWGDLLLSISNWSREEEEVLIGSME